MDDTDSSYDQEKIQAQFGLVSVVAGSNKVFFHVFSLHRNRNIFYSVTVLSLICD